MEGQQGSFDQADDAVFLMNEVELKDKATCCEWNERQDCEPRSPKWSEGAAVCRICHSGEASLPFNGQKAEPLISTCHCRGTMGLYHRSCLERWLAASNSETCEICKFKYPLERTPQPFFMFLKNPGSAAERRNLIGDSICWFILTPLALCSAWLCIQGAVHYAQLGKDTVEVPGLISLAVFLTLTYFVWLGVSIRYHYKVWSEWKVRNQVVKIRKESSAPASPQGARSPPAVAIHLDAPSVSFTSSVLV